MPIMATLKDPIVSLAATLFEIKKGIVAFAIKKL
jgi:hypothetical protein